MKLALLSDGQDHEEIGVNFRGALQAVGNFKKHIRQRLIMVVIQHRGTLENLKSIISRTPAQLWIYRYVVPEA